MRFRLALWVTLLTLISAQVGCGRSALVADQPGFPDRGLPDVVPTDVGVPLCTTSPDLLGCYEFEGSVADGSSYGRNAQATAVGYEGGPFGLALGLSAASGVLVADDPVFDGPVLTFEMWVRANTLGSNWMLLRKTGEYRLELQADGTLRSGCGGDSANSVLTLSTSWSHVALVVGSGSMRIYLDGVLEDSDQCTIVGGGGPLHLGEDDDGGNQWLGAFDRLRIWGIVRTAEEICTEAGSC